MVQGDCYNNCYNYCLMVDLARGFIFIVYTKGWIQNRLCWSGDVSYCREMRSTDTIDCTCAGYLFEIRLISEPGLVG